MLCLGVVFVTPRHSADMFPLARGPLLACSQIVPKANWITLRSPGMHPFERLWNWFSLFSLALALGAAFLIFVWSCRLFWRRLHTLFVRLVPLVCFVRRGSAARRNGQHVLCNGHICVKLPNQGVQGHTGNARGFQGSREGLAQPDEGMPVSTQQLCLADLLKPRCRAL